MNYCNNRQLISIIILTYNGIEERLKETLSAIFSQKTDLIYEVIAIDSGSSDGTIDLIKSYNSIKLHQIPNSEFNHGKTRQFGAEIAKGDILVFLTQDATPANEQWLNNLVSNFFDADVVGVCSRVLPRKEACLLKQIEVNMDLAGRKEKIVAKINNAEEFQKLSFYEKRLKYYFFHNISSAIRGGYLISHPFPCIQFAEDVEFAKNALGNGCKIVFEPNSIVLHSHKYALVKTFKRNLIDSKYHKKYLGIATVPTISALLRNMRNRIFYDFVEIKKYDSSWLAKISALIYSPLIHFVEQLAQYLGTKRQ